MLYNHKGIYNQYDYTISNNIFYSKTTPLYARPSFPPSYASSTALSTAMRGVKISFVMFVKQTNAFVKTIPFQLRSIAFREQTVNFALAYISFGPTL